MITCRGFKKGVCTYCQHHYDRVYLFDWPWVNVDKEVQREFDRVEYESEQICGGCLPVFFDNEALPDGIVVEG